MKKFLSIYLLFTGLVILSSCEKDNENETTKFYSSFTLNSDNYHFDNCNANLSEISSGDSIQYKTSIFSGVESTEKNDSSILFPGFCIIFPDKVAKTFNNDNIEGLNYYVAFTMENGSYSYPSLSSSKGDEYFELTITEYDLNSNVIKGTFHGKIANPTDTTDYAEINDGEFVSTLLQIGM